MKKFNVVICLLCLPAFAFCQDNNWDLQRCVDYALSHNISVRQSDVQQRLSAIQLKQAKAMQIPTLSMNSQAGEHFGRYIYPTTNQFATNNSFSQNYGLQSGITLFNFFSQQHAIKSAKALDNANKFDIERAKNDVALNVAAAYLQYLLSLEQVNIAQGQIALSQKQLDITNKQVAAGSLPELNSAQLESQLATDSSTYITNEATMIQNKLQLLALLNLSADAPFNVSLPDVEAIPLIPLSEMQPQDVYHIALRNQYQQKVDSLNILSALEETKSARAQMYPSIQMSGSMNSNYASKDPYGFSYSKQVFNANLSEFIGLSLNIPIFNSRQLRSNYEKSKENVISAELTQEKNNQALQQNIYTAYSNAQSGIQNYNANTKSESYSAYAYELAQKRYDIGIMSTSDYLIAQNNLYTAKMNKAAAHFEYIFRLKVLEFYKYNHIKL
ncbi:TolC family protein [Arachidicoccus sp.]|uniref:TolC family protein n=1 Tax=Arachidicoccus sp. TaxID=1872624 RepID=UPI003D205C18